MKKLFSKILYLIIFIFIDIGTIYAQNSVFASSINSVDFGSDTAGIAKKDSVIIYNRGTDTLDVTSISSTNALFTFSPSVFTIAPLDSSMLTLIFTPVDTTSQSGLILLTNSSPSLIDTIFVKGKGITASLPVPIVTNGGFESSDTGVVDSTNIKGWLIQVGTDVSVAPVFQIESNNVQQGNRALAVTVNSIGTNTWDIQVIADSVRVTQGQTYLYTIWAKAANAGAQVNLTMGNYAFTEYSAIRPANLTTQWQKFTMAFTVNDNQTVIRGPIHFSYASNVGNTIYIDNLQIVNINDTGRVWEGPPLATGKSKFLGNIFSSSSQMHSDFAYYWNQVTPGNDGKWGSVELSQGVYTWTSLDTEYNYAVAKGFPFKEHNLIWGSQQPSFISSLDSAQQYQEIANWIQACGQRYPHAAFCDVVNEPINTPPNGQNGTANYIKALGGSGATGWDWVISAFQLARLYWSSNTKLLINEYNVLGSTTNNNTYIQIINLLKTRGLIDGIGIQCHYFEFQSYQGESNQYAYPMFTLQSSLNNLAATGLPIYISEFDINEASDSIQLASYQKYFPFLWTNTAVKGVTLWGFEQGDMWQTNAYLINYDGTERPAMTWLRKYVDTVTITSVNIVQAQPNEYKLFNNYPNPFNPSTTIEFSVPVRTFVILKIYDILGREVQIACKRREKPGNLFDNI